MTSPSWRPTAPFRAANNPEELGAESPLTFFTICAKNYTAYARTLFDSLRQFHSDARFLMVLGDRADAGYDVKALPFEVVQLHDLAIADWQGMAQRYSITEFNTAIKPHVFSHLFRTRGDPRVVYLDPDILVVSRLTEVEEAFRAGANAVLTPHILEPAENAEMHDLRILQFGVYNLGFIGLRDTAAARQFVAWWSRRLERECVIRLDRGLFVDQRWADLLPAFVDRASILRHPGYNVAYWNLSQRTVKQIDGSWHANGQELRFVHFSGSRLADPTVFSRHSGVFTPDNIGDLRLLLDEYRERVHANGHAEYVKLPYAFSWSGASGVNLHAPSPEDQADKGPAAPGIHDSLAESDSPSPRLGMATLARWTRRVRAARTIAGGWVPLSRKALSAVRRGGIGALRERVRMVDGALASVPPQVPRDATRTSGAEAAIPRVFVTDWSTPRPDQDAGSLATYFVLKLLVELGCDVTFVPSDLRVLEGYTDSLRRLGVRCLHADDIGSISRHLAQEGGAYALFLLFRAPIAALYLSDIRRYAPRAKTILETVDLHYLREERRAEAVEASQEARASALATKRLELGVISRCDVSIVINPVEKEVLARELPAADVRHVPLLFVDVDVSRRSSAGFDERRDVVFLGGFRHQPNIDAVLFFCSAVWPQVRARLPEARFVIVGSHATREVLALAGVPGVVIAGHVPDLGPVLGAARLSVAPLTYGSGLKGKVATSLGHGVPVVATTLALEGMDLVAGEHAIVADTPRAIEEAIVELHTNRRLWEDLRRAGYRRAVALFSEQAGRRRLRALLADVLPRKADFEFQRFSSFDAYRTHRDEQAEECERRHGVEIDLIPERQDRFYVDGYCAVCRQASVFEVGFMYAYRVTEDGRSIPNWREHLNCTGCGFTNRIRATLHVLRDVVRPAPRARLYVTEKTTPLFRHLGRSFRNLVGSEYLGSKVPLGATVNGVRNEDLTALTFADASFDYVVSLDVLEHVPDDAAAFSECYRCLAPGGVLLFTAPYDLASRTNIVRARTTEDGSVEHILAPEYHGNPVDPKRGSLCYRYFGWEVIQQLESAGFVDVEALVYWSRDLAYLGGDQVIFTARKAAGVTGHRRSRE